MHTPMQSDFIYIIIVRISKWWIFIIQRSMKMQQLEIMQGLESEGYLELEGILGCSLIYITLDTSSGIDGMTKLLKSKMKECNQLNIGAKFVFHNELRLSRYYSNINFQLAIIGIASSKKFDLIFAQKNHVQSFDNNLIAMMCRINNTVFIEKYVQYRNGTRK